MALLGGRQRGGVRGAIVRGGGFDRLEPRIAFARLVPERSEPGIGVPNGVRGLGLARAELGEIALRRYDHRIDHHIGDACLAAKARAERVARLLERDEPLRGFADYQPHIIDLAPDDPHCGIIGGRHAGAPTSSARRAKSASSAPGDVLSCFSSVSICGAIATAASTSGLAPSLYAPSRTISSISA